MLATMIQSATLMDMSVAVENNILIDDLLPDAL